MNSREEAPRHTAPARRHRRQSMPSAEDGDDNEENDASPSPLPPPPPAPTAAAVRALCCSPLLFATMFDLRDTCRVSLLCRQTRKSFGRKARKRCLTHGSGVPEDRRVEFWSFVLNVEKVCVACGVPFSPERCPACLCVQRGCCSFTGDSGSAPYDARWRFANT